MTGPISRKGSRPSSTSKGTKLTVFDLTKLPHRGHLTDPFIAVALHDAPVTKLPWPSAALIVRVTDCGVKWNLGDFADRDHSWIMNSSAVLAMRNAKPLEMNWEEQKGTHLFYLTCYFSRGRRSAAARPPSF